MSTGTLRPGCRIPGQECVPRVRLCVPPALSGRPAAGERRHPPKALPIYLVPPGRVPLGAGCSLRAASPGAVAGTEDTSCPVASRLRDSRPVCGRAALAFHQQKRRPPPPPPTEATVTATGPAVCQSQGSFKGDDVHVQPPALSWRTCQEVCPGAGSGGPKAEGHCPRPRTGSEVLTL